MPFYFLITGELPVATAKAKLGEIRQLLGDGAKETGPVQVAPTKSNGYYVVIPDAQTAGGFRGLLRQLGARYEELNELPEGLTIRTKAAAPSAPGRAMTFEEFLDSINRREA